MLTVGHITCKNFRCFSTLNLELGDRFILCEDRNAAGKTSLVEALHYACYLRSFRTYAPRDLIKIGTEGFFIQVGVQDSKSMANDISIGFSKGQRLVKIGEQVLQSHKELMQQYRVLSITDEDSAIVRGDPLNRRSFLDLVCSLQNLEYRTTLRATRQACEQRNALLGAGGGDYQMYQILTDQFVTLISPIQQQRIEQLGYIEQYINNFLHENMPHLSVHVSYQQKNARFLAEQDWQNLWHEERRFGRSLIGAHLDDFHVTLNDKKSRSFVSRGQQKLITILFKLATLQQMIQEWGSTIVLIDDFLTDLDDQVGPLLLHKILGLASQLIMTAPVYAAPTSSLARDLGARVIHLS